MTTAANDALVVRTEVVRESDPNTVAEAIALEVLRIGKAIIHVVGLSATDRALRAIAIARGLVAPSDIELVCYPVFLDIDVDGTERPATLLHIEPR